MVGDTASMPGRQQGRKVIQNPVQQRGGPLELDIVTYQGQRIIEARLVALERATQLLEGRFTFR